jgi:hypothetical protein
MGLMATHIASVAIAPMPGAFVGLGDTVARCIARGCDAFVYAVSNGVAAISRPVRVDGTTVLRVWDHNLYFPDDPQFIQPFLRQRLPLLETIHADLYASRDVQLAWAGVDVAMAGPRRWLEKGDIWLAIPLYFLAQPRWVTVHRCD